MKEQFRLTKLVLVAIDEAHGIADWLASDVQLN